MEITRYGDVGTIERHAKFGGVTEDVVDGQPRARCIESYLDAFLEAKVFNQEQHSSVYQLIRDYQKGYLWQFRMVREYCDAHGLTNMDADMERELSRRSYDAAIRYNQEFTKLSHIAHILLEQMGVYIPPVWKLQQLADRLTKYYCNCPRIELELTSST